jgi:hypothetical protein
MECDAHAAAPGLLNTDLNAHQLFTEDPTDLADGLRNLDGDATTAAILWDEVVAKWDTSAVGVDYATAPSAEQDRAVNDLRRIRGLTAADINDTTSNRSWYMGDPLHSRPRPINYGARGGYTATNPDIRIVIATPLGRESLLKGLKRSPAATSHLNWAAVLRRVTALQNRCRLKKSHLGSIVMLLP